MLPAAALLVVALLLFALPLLLLIPAPAQAATRAPPSPSYPAHSCPSPLPLHLSRCSGGPYLGGASDTCEGMRQHTVPPLVGCAAKAGTSLTIPATC